MIVEKRPTPKRPSTLTRWPLFVPSGATLRDAPAAGPDRRKPVRLFQKVLEKRTLGAYYF
jgi:hypothetical protein